MQISPVPGGVGPMTVAMLLRNTMNNAKRRRGAARLTPPQDQQQQRVRSYYGLFPYNPYFRNHARLRFTYIFYSRITDYMETHPYPAAAAATASSPA